jgi:hypothetical protein
MSSVSSSDSGLANYYHKTMKELKEETEREDKRTRDLQEKQIARMEKNFKQSLEKRDREASDGMESLKKASAKSLTKEREKFDAAVEKMRDDTYNRRGIYQSEEERQKRVIDELQNKIDTEKDRNRTHEEQTVNLLQDHFEDSYLKQQRDSSEALRKVREESAGALTHEHQKNKEEVSTLREQSRKEKKQDQEGMEKYYKKTINDMVGAGETRAKRDQKLQEQEIKRLDERTREAFLDKERDMSQTIKEIKKNANEKIENSRLQNKAELDSLKNMKFNPSEQTPGAIDPNVYRTELQGLHDNLKHEEARNRENVAHLEDDFHMKTRAAARSEDNRIRELTRQHSEENKDQSDRIKALQNYDRKLEHQNSETMSKLVSNQMEERRAENARIHEAFDSDVNRLHHSLNEKDAIYQRHSAESLKAKDDHYSEIINRQNNEFYDRFKTLDNDFKHQSEQLQKQRNREVELSEKKLETLLKNASHDREKALEFQAKSYQDTIANNRKSEKTNIEELQKALHRSKTTTSSNDISPAAAEAVRKPIVEDYQKRHEQEVERSQQAMESMQRKYLDQYKQTIEDHQEKETQMHQRNNTERTINQNRYLDSIHELDEQAKVRLKEKDAYTERAKEHLYRQFGNALERQKRDYEHIFASTNLDHEARLSSLRQEMEINAKVSQRALNARQNELIRDYEKKLSDQKIEYDFIIDELKSQAQLDVRNLERKSRQELETQSKMYEQKLAQTEAQNKERERYIAQNNQDEMDRMRRSYELLSKKKS